MGYFARSEQGKVRVAVTNVPVLCHVPPSRAVDVHEMGGSGPSGEYIDPILVDQEVVPLEPGTRGGTVEGPRRQLILLLFGY